jgi:hypothetical protein
VHPAAWMAGGQAVQDMGCREVELFADRIHAIYSVVMTELIKMPPHTSDT